MTKTIITRSLIIAIFSTMWACNSSKNASERSETLDELIVEPQAEKIYRASRTREIDILHTRLDLSFNWDSSFVMGKASLWIKPYFYSISEINLDAKGFKINQVSTKNGEDLTDLKFEYNKKELKTKTL